MQTSTKGLFFSKWPDFVFHVQVQLHFLFTSMALGGRWSGLTRGCPDLCSCLSIEILDSEVVAQTCVGRSMSIFQ